MTKEFKIGNLNVKLHFNHYWEGIIQKITLRDRSFGVYYKKRVSIGSGKANQGMKMFNNDNHVATHIFGIQLGWVKMSISLTFGDILIFGDTQPHR
jgi:hypothetical protein